MRHPSLIAVVGWCAAALLVISGATAATGLGPDGTTIKASLDASGAITSPKTVELKVLPAPEDTDVVVWVSRTPARTPAGAPERTVVASCRGGELVQTAEPGVLACRVRTALLDASVTYYWWVVAGRNDGSPPAVAGPYTFSLGAKQSSRSDVTAASAPRLVTRSVFTGARSIKHARLTAAIARAYRRVRTPRTLAVACWTDPDFASVLAASGVAQDSKEDRIYGVWFGEQPRWLHLAGRTCAAIERLVRGSGASGVEAFGLVIALHEAAHAYGVREEAKANCYAVQLVPLGAQALGVGRRRAERLGRSAVEFTRATAPQGYWDTGRCRDGRAWDLHGVGTPLG